MNIKRTRELLGDDVKDLSDDEILIFLRERSNLCDILIDIFDRELLTREFKKNKNVCK